MKAAFNARITSFVDATWRHPANRGFERFSSVSKTLAWEVYNRAVTRRLPWSVRIHSGMRMYCYPACTCSKWAICTRGWKDWLAMGFVKHYLRPGDGFLDVGANVGLYSLLAASVVTPSGRIDAFEPTPETARQLKENLELNGFGHARVYEMAVGSSPGIVAFHVQRDDSLNRIQTERDFHGVSVNVQCARLDDVVGDGHYALGKIDIEGAELAALQGAQSMLIDQNPPVWLLEVNDSLKAYGYTETEFWDWLALREYALAVYIPDTRKLEFVGKDWLSIRNRPDNVLAIARPQKEFVLDRLRSYQHPGVHAY